MRRVWTASFACSLVVVGTSCGAVLKPPAPNRRLDVHISGSVFEAGNGYRFGVLPEPGATVLRLDVRYPVGSADDPPGKEGLAHLVEHLLFDVEITRDGAKTSIGAELGRIALSWNAITERDSTTYQVVAAPGALDELLRLEVDRLAVGCAGLTPEIFAREREVVLNELRENQGASGAAVQRLIDEAVYPAGHAYRKVDSVDTVAKLELADACAFLAGPYQRDKAMVIASGAITGPDLQTAAGHHYGRLPNRVVAAHAVPPPVEPEHRTVRLKADVDDPMMIATWPLPPMPSRDYRLLQLATRYIAGRVDAFAYTYGWGSNADAWLLGGAHAPVLAVAVELSSADKAGDATDAFEKAAAYAQRVVYRGGDTKKTASWQALWHVQAESLLARWESLDGRNAMFADFLQYDSDERYLIGRIAELAEAEPKEVRDLAATWLAPSRVKYLLIEPSGSARTGRRQTFSGGAEEHAVRVDGALADRPLPLPAGSLAIQTERYTTGNGMSVIMWPHGNAPIVHGRLVIDSGAAHDPAGKEGVSDLVGATSVRSDSLVFEDRSLATDVDALILSLGLELRSPGYELDDDGKKYLKGQLRKRRAQERMTYERDFAAALYGDGHPYARGSMTEDSLDDIHRDLVMDWARGHIVPRNATLIVAGQFDPDLVKKHVAYNTDQVSGGKDSANLDALAQTSPGRVRGVEVEPSPTVELDVGFVGGRGLDSDYARRLVLAGVLESVLSDLRGKQALTYGFSASYSPRRAGGMWRISGEVDAARAAEGAAALAGALAAMRTDAESYRTAFVLARQKVLDGLLLSTGDSEAIAERLELLARFDGPDDFFDQVARDVAGLTLSDFHDFVVVELAPHHQVFGAFGNAADVDAALAASETAGAKVVDPGF